MERFISSPERQSRREEIHWRMDQGDQYGQIEKIMQTEWNNTCYANGKCC